MEKGRKEDEKDNWEWLVLPAEYEAEHPHKCNTALGFEDPRTEEGELLWADRVGYATLRKLSAGLGPYAAAGQLQQRPSPKEGGVIKREWFQWFDMKDLPENN